MRDHRSIRLSTLLCLVSIGAGAGHLVPRMLDAPPAGDAGPAAMEGARGLSQAFKELSERIGPAVVSIRSYDEVSRGGTTRRRRLAQGSGVIVGSAGVVVTNHHVVAGADEYRVYLTDGRELEAELVGSDRDTDLAILRLPEGQYEAAPLDPEGSPAVGEWVLAMGNPLGLGHTVTAGIISGKGRAGLGIARYEDFLQTDAAINPGNSGGPLIDLDGQVIGINTAIGTRADGSQGIGFAIPSRMVRGVLEGILEGGRVRRGWLGVSLDDLALRQVEELGYEGPSRVAVIGVLDDSPAKRAGLLVGDVIETIGGRQVSTTIELMNAVAEIRPGTLIEVDLWRSGSALQVPVTLGDRERDASD